MRTSSENVLKRGFLVNIPHYRTVYKNICNDIAIFDNIPVTLAPAILYFGQTMVVNSKTAHNPYLAENSYLLQSFHDIYPNQSEIEVGMNKNVWSCLMIL